MRFILLLCSSLLTMISAHSQTSITLTLHDGWQFRQADSGEWRSATIPGCVHTDLLAQEQIQDPYYRLQELDVQWVDKVDWEYRTVVVISEQMANKQVVELMFEGLDTQADVYWDGMLVLTANNAFRTWRIPLTGSQKTQGRHLLRVYFYSPITIGLQKQEVYGTQLPAINDQSKRGEVPRNRKVSPYLRKPPYHFGWDWGPRLVTSGIWKPVYLRGWDMLSLSELYFRQDSVSTKQATVTAQMDIEARQSGAAMLHLYINGAEVDEFPVALSEGTNHLEFPFVMDRPRLWWTHDLGEPYLYQMEMRLTVVGEEVGRIDRSVGLRDIRLVQQPDPEGEGRSFFFQLNGAPVFAKGANYIPQDIFPTRVTPEQEESLILSAKAANMNMIRVWGGGIYETDHFYDLCDRHGILIWQDFMFACSMYPGNTEFLDNVRQEAIDQVRRIRHHACLALWCGNNEIDLAWAQYNPLGGWGWKQRYKKKTRKKIWEAYQAVFHRILPEVVADLDPVTDYWPSSPYEKEGGHSSNTSVSGDIHYWGVWHGEHPFERFYEFIGRFMSEYGFQSFPELATVNTYTLPEDHSIESEVMASHQRSGIGNLRIRSYMKDHYVVPESFEHQLYVGQLLQAKGIRTAIEAHRFARPWCMGTLYWQLNDCWPVASWSGMDYYHRWKALHYAVQDAFRPVIVGVKQNKDQWEIHVSSDRPDSVEAVLLLTQMDMAGNTWQGVEVPVLLEPQIGRLLHSLDPESWTDGKDLTSSLLHIRLLDQEGEELASRIHYFLPEKTLNLPQPQLEIVVSAQEDQFLVTVTTDSLAKNVFLHSPVVSSFSDNFFDLLPGESKTVELQANVATEEELELGVMTLAETMK